MPQYYENRYLDANTADVKFLFGFGTGHVEVVPAHKSILSSKSAVFEAMFDGSSIMIENDDASAAAFKEFLQLFYMRKIRLTLEHRVEVQNLCKKYINDDGLKLIIRN